ncbi:U2 small nuclear ribonucleoprotein auxiliary factor 35 kda subunit-related protein 1-like [Plakobranchus ocellatus]|uniref:U2 small nuclear ribonucleoprotein auxiliary factor 35 kDa subunit-related protein 1-like n=1 Tax=Plakobranchus ocellatus TaxID=259542 RepID=A0AAV4AVZ4_9GAST|nr:U2 small nuclear ribonucleoprotein auxiliary factor 35 kda subunit-related protein 1-like [Plakobranchus ocellatus]
MKRKKKRTELAKERDKNEAQEEEVTDSEEEKRREQEEEEKSLRQNLLWMQREREAQAAFRAKKEWEEKERRRKEEIERKIKEEWAERELKEKEEQEAKEKKEAERKEKQKKLLEEATAHENKEPWHNPIGPVQYSQEKKVEVCPFFKKTAACRFGEECSRHHEYPESSTTILIPRMFTCIELEQSVVDALDADMSLEFEESDLYQSFRDFYADVVPEFKTVGTVVQVKVCCNCEPHLKGNVYVQYRSERSAQKAYEKFNARWYGGRQLTCIFVNIESWKAAICGLAFRKRCPKGKHCNFLHVFRNPGGEFADMDQDWPASERRDRGTRGRYGEEGRRSERRSRNDDADDDHKRDRRRSESVRSSRSHRESASRSRFRSRSKERQRHEHRKKSRSRSKNRSSNRRRDRSNSKSRGQSTVSRQRSRSRSYERSSKLKRRRSRSTERLSVARNDSRSRSREADPKYRHTSRSPMNHRLPKKYKHRSRSRSADNNRHTLKHRSRSRSADNNRRKLKHRSRSRSADNNLDTLKHRSRSRSAGNNHHRSRSKSRDKLSLPDSGKESKSNTKVRSSKSLSPKKATTCADSLSKSSTDKIRSFYKQDSSLPDNDQRSRRSEDSSPASNLSAGQCKNGQEVVESTSSRSSTSSSSDSDSDSVPQFPLKTSEKGKIECDSLRVNNVLQEASSVLDGSSRNEMGSHSLDSKTLKAHSDLPLSKSSHTLEPEDQRREKKRKKRRRKRHETDGEDSEDEEYVYVEKTKESI